MQILGDYIPIDWPLPGAMHELQLQLQLASTSRRSLRGAHFERPSWDWKAMKARLKHPRRCRTAGRYGEPAH
eukprot:scaffold206116_cov39-Tisochrysis_lutea.AAC.1